MVREKNNQFGILHDLQNAIPYYSGSQVYLRSLDDAFIILFDDKDLQDMHIPKKDGRVEDGLFQEAVNYLQDILKASYA